MAQNIRIRPTPTRDGLAVFEFTVTIEDVELGSWEVSRRLRRQCDDVSVLWSNGVTSLAFARAGISSFSALDSALNDIIAAGIGGRVCHGQDAHLQPR
jgi:hypothetical protein